MKFKLTFLSIFFIGVFFSSYGQKKERVVYHMQVSGKPLGKFIIWRQVGGDTTQYWGALDFRVRLGITYHGQQEMYALFYDNVLDSSFVSFRKDGKLKHELAVQKKGAFYRVVDNQKERRINGVITNCSLGLYYDEPVGQKYSYSERDGTFKIVEYREENGYHIYTTMKDHNDTPSVFFYKNGVLEKVVVKYSLLTFQMVREI